MRFLSRKAQRELVEAAREEERIRVLERQQRDARAARLARPTRFRWGPDEEDSDVERRLVASQPQDKAGREYRRALLTRFEDARVTRDLALELNTRAERAMQEALAKYDEARKAVRRISELDRDR